MDIKNIFVIIIILIFVGIGIFGIIFFVKASKTPSPDSAEPTSPSTTSMPSTPPTQTTKPTIAIPISGNTLNVPDNGYSQTSKENNNFKIGTYKNIDINNGSAYCRNSGNPPKYAISCGIPTSQYKYIADFNTIDTGYSGTKVIMSNVDNSGRSLFCRGVGSNAGNPQMACVGLTADGNAWDPSNQYYMIGKIGNASDYGLKYTP